MSNTLILFDTVTTLLNAVTATGAGSTFALPSRAASIGVQWSVDVNAGNFTVLIQVSLDGTNWYTILTTTQADLVSLNYVTTLTGVYAAKFIRANLSVDSVPHAVTVQVLLKPAI